MAEKSLKLAKFLKTSRESSGLSQKLVADKFGYTTPQFISNWERGVSNPPLKALKKLAQIYGINADKLFDVLLDDTIERLTVQMKRQFFGKKTSA